MLNTLTKRRLQTALRPSVFAHSQFPIRTMATGKKPNEELKASKLFDVSGFTAVVTGGGTGIGLSTCIAVLYTFLIYISKVNPMSLNLFTPGL